MGNQLYEFNLKTRRTDGSSLPNDIVGAYVPTYVGAPDHETALRNAVTKLAGIGLTFEGLEGKVRELPIERWSDYVASVWPDVSEGLPGPIELPGLVAEGAVFFGPFAAFGGKSETA